MNWILDGIIIAIFILAVINSAKRGFVYTVVELCGYILSVVIALSLSTVVAQTVYNSAVEQKIRPKIEEKVIEIGVTGLGDVVDKVWEENKFITAGASLVGIEKESIKSEVIELKGQENDKVVDYIMDNTVKPIVVFIIRAGAFIVLFLLLMIVVKIVAKSLNTVFSFHIIGTLNKALGGILGGAKGVILSLLFCAAVNLAVSLSGGGFLSINSQTINGTYIFKYLSEIF